LKARGGYESPSIGQEDLREMQDRAPQGSRPRHLLDPEAQAEAGMRVFSNSWQ
jgi:hypothetical protein